MQASYRALHRSQPRSTAPLSGNDNSRRLRSYKNASRPGGKRYLTRLILLGFCRVFARYAIRLSTFQSLRAWCRGSRHDFRDIPSHASGSCVCAVVQVHFCNRRPACETDSGSPFLAPPGKNSKNFCVVAHATNPVLCCRDAVLICEGAKNSWRLYALDT